MNEEQIEKTSKELTKPDAAPKSLQIAETGISTGKDFAKLMSALMSDLISGRVSPGVGNATCNAGGKLLKVVEMQMRYGTKGPGAGDKTLRLTSDDSSSAVPA